jgi:hypothetical protein
MKILSLLLITFWLTALIQKDAFSQEIIISDTKNQEIDQFFLSQNTANFEEQFSQKLVGNKNSNYESGLIDSRPIEVVLTGSIIKKSATKKFFGLNWYLNQNSKISFNFSNNNFKSGILNKKYRGDDNAFLTKLQFNF